MSENIQYIVRLMRNDNKPNVDYTYDAESNAQKAFEIFADDNECYCAIQLIKKVFCEETILRVKVLLNISSAGIKIIKRFGTKDQLETCIRLKRLVDTHKVENEYDTVKARIEIEKLSPKQYVRFFDTLSLL